MIFRDFLALVNNNINRMQQLKFNLKKSMPVFFQPKKLQYINKCIAMILK